MVAYLGIDVGTSGTKALAMDARGHILAQSTASHPAQHPQPLWSEQDPDDWWRSTVQSVQGVVRKARLKPTDVKVIGLSGQMHGSVFLDDKNKVLRRAILWNDQRTALECQAIEQAAGGRKGLVKLVANPALTGFTAPKILWVRKHEPRIYARVAKVLLPKDEIRRRLTGEFATDVSDASGTLLFDVAKRTWSKTLLDKLQIDHSLMPPCFESVEVTGTLTKEAAKQLGLSIECRVVAGAGDCAANAIGTGIVRQGELSTSVGSSGVMFVHTDEMQVDPQGRLHTFCHAVTGKWHMMGVTLTAAGAFEWFVREIVSPRGKGTQANIYSVLNREANEAPPGSEGLYFLPYLAGERTPHADPDARGCWIGLTLKHHRGHLVRSIMEGVCFAMRDSLEILNELDVPVKKIRVSGGGSKSPLWRQIQADVFGQRVSTLSCEEGPSMGVAMLAAVAGGEFKDIQEACQSILETTSETSVNPANRKVYQKTFPRFQSLYQSLKAEFPLLHS
jgi:xylulokinase